MFERGEHVVHPRHGAGTIVGTRTIERDGVPCRYRCIELLDDQGTVMIPEDQLEQAGLRKAIADARLIRTIMRRSPKTLPDHYRLRQERLKAKIASGDPRQLIQALRDLCWRERHRSLSSTDIALKTRAFRLLAHELALKSALEVDAAQNRLDAIIRKAMQAHLTVERAM